MPSNLIAEKGSLLEIGKVYNIKRFRVTRVKTSYKVTKASIMIYFTLYSVIEICQNPPSTFPLCL
jgi:hypothetical protein